MLAELRRRRFDARAAMLELEGAHRHRHGLVRARHMLMAMQDLARLQLRVLERFVHFPHASRGHVARLEIVLPFLGRPFRQDLAQLCRLRFVIVLAVLVVLAAELGPSQRIVQPVVLALIARRQHEQPVLRLVAAIARERVAVAVRLRSLARIHVSRDVRREHHERDVQHRAVDVLALAGALALEQRAGEGEGAHRAGRVVDDRRADLDRMDIRRAGRRHHAGQRLDGVVVGRLVSARAVLSEGGHRAVDQLRIDLLHVFVADAEGRECAGPVILDHDVGVLDELLEDRAAALLLQVEGDGPLVRALRHEAGSHVPPVQCAVVAGLAALVALHRVLDLDHVGAVVGQQLAAPRAGQHAAQVEHAHALQGPRGVVHRRIRR